MTITYAIGLGTLPNNLDALRTGTANDGRALISCGLGPQRQSAALADVRSRLPQGWTASIYEASGCDIVITHVG